MQLSCLLCPEPYWVIPALLFPALFALLPSVHSGEEGHLSLFRIPLFLWCGCLLTAFSESAYYNLYGALRTGHARTKLGYACSRRAGRAVEHCLYMVLGQRPTVRRIWYGLLLVIGIC